VPNVFATKSFIRIVSEHGSVLTHFPPHYTNIVVNQSNG